MAIRVSIVDDDGLIRESLKIILGANDELEVVSTYENGMEFLKGISKDNADVALLDIRMPILNGVQTLKELKLRDNKIKVIVLTTFDEDEFIDECLNNGARGYLLKNNTPDKIIETIKLVQNGISVIQEGVLDKFTGGFSKEGNIDTSIFTERELEVVREISKGLSNKEISNKLFISEGTVKNYITSILNKTGLKHRTQIAIYYIKGDKES